MDSYNTLFSRLPKSLLTGISKGCRFGDSAYRQILNSEPKLFSSPYIHGIPSRVHEKAIHLYLEDFCSSDVDIILSQQHIGFGNHILRIDGKGFMMHPCHVSTIDALPSTAKYKRKAAKNNPGFDINQLNLFSPPVAPTYKDIYFVLSLYFDGYTANPCIVIPDNRFLSILASKSIVSIVSSEEYEEDIAYQERKMPQLIAEVKMENELNS